MKITAIVQQQRDKHRVNLSIDGSYRLSLDIFQIGSLGLRVGQEIDEDSLAKLEQESQFGKLYTRALDYCLLRLHSAKEIRDYLYRKTLPRQTKTGQLKPGVSVELTQRVFDRLQEKGYINDQLFAEHWVNYRHTSMGASRRKLEAELRQKGVSPNIITASLQASGRNDLAELRQVIAKKGAHYTDPLKLQRYLASQGFSYQDIKTVLAESD